MTTDDCFPSRQRNTQIFPGRDSDDISQSEPWEPDCSSAETITGEFGVIGARFIMAGGPSEGRFSLVEHPIVPRGLAAPVHVHTREDEFSFVIEGRWGFQLGSDVVYAEPGDLVYKPRDVWHTF